MSELAGIIDDVVKYHLTCLEAHNQIKALMLDLINASDAYVATGSDNGVWRSDKDLREKVNEL